MKRWKCPTCNSGVLAPGKPRRIDVRRYCLDCSAKSGVLVERVCPTLDKRRVVSKAKSTAKAKEKRVKSSEKYIVEGYDIRRAFKPVATLLDSNKNDIIPPRVRCHPERIKHTRFKVWRRAGPWSSGWASGWNIHLTLGQKLDDALFVLIHEMVHNFLESGIRHGPPFKSVERNAVQLFNESRFRANNNLPEISRR